MSCPTCQQVNCEDVPDVNLYSLESQVFPFVLNCPPGYDCNNASGFSIVCCGQLLSVAFDTGESLEDKLAAIQKVLADCANRQAYCGELNPVPPPPDQPVQYYYNVPKACTAKCPDGTFFTYTVIAGTFSGLTQAQADSAAQAYACQQAALRKMCLGSLKAKLCANVAYSESITETGGVGPFKWEIVDGSLPTGVNLDEGSGALTGTPTVGTSYTFTVRVTSLSDGSYSNKTFTMCVVDISPSSSTLPLAAVNIPVIINFTASGCAQTPLSWQVVGSLPPGLTLNEETGALTGKPTTPGTYPFTIKVQDAAT